MLSKVMIICEDKAYKELNKIFASYPEIYPHEGFKKDNLYVSIWKDIEWYRGKDSISEVMEKLTEFDTKYTGKDDGFMYRKEAENGYDYSYCRIGESLNDNDYKNHKYTRMSFKEANFPIGRVFCFPQTEAKHKHASPIKEDLEL